MAGQGLCAIQASAGRNTYGTWGTFARPSSSSGLKGCFFVQDDPNNYAQANYFCACLPSGPTALSWAANSACATHATYAASTSPGVCRFSKYQDATAWAMGWSNDGVTCYTGNFNYGPGGAWVSSATQGAAGYTVSMLCKPQGV